jgi:Tfp pilus assembly protein PilN
LPETIAARASIGRARRTHLAIILSVLALVAVAFVYFDRARLSAAISKREASASTSLEAMRNKRDSILDELNEANGMEKVLERGFHPGQRLGDVAALVSNRLPANAWLTNLSISRGQALTVRGTAMSGEDVTSYVSALTQEPRFREVRLIFANNALIESTPVIQFSASAFPIGNLPLVEKSAAKGGRRR